MSSVSRLSRAHLAAAAVVLLSSLGSAPAWAQDAEAPPPAEATETPAEAPAPEAAPPPAEAAPVEAAPVERPAEPSGPAERRYARPRAALPIMVVVVPGERVSEEVSAGAREALVAQITPLAAGRPVHGLGVAEMVQAIAACSQDACLGAQFATAGAQAGVILRLTRRGRQLAATLEVRDPVSGTVRAEAIEGRLPMVAAELVEPLAQLSAQLASAMPDAPGATPTLLVTTTQDGGMVTVDGEDIGESPVAPFEIADGPHEILVRLAGFGSFHTQTQVSPGERARVDATLVSLTAAELDAATSPFATEGGQEDEELTSQWWFWTIVGGGAAVVLGIAIGVGVAVAGSGQSTPLTPGGIPLPPITGGP